MLCSTAAGLCSRGRRESASILHTVRFHNFYVLFEHANASQVPCANVVNKCCPSGYECYTDRCCVAGSVPCGLNCYYPSTTKCCSDGSSCKLGYDCMEGGGCCPSGEIRCGQSRCFNPATQKCCVGSGYAWACRTSEECCTLGGAIACVNPNIEQCCPGGTCDKEHTCCGKQCCGASSVCGGNGLCTKKYTTPAYRTTSRATSPPTSKQTNTPKETTTRKQTTTPIQPSTSTLRTPKIPSSTTISSRLSSTSSGRPTQTITFIYDPRRQVKATNGEMVSAPQKAVWHPQLFFGMTSLLTVDRFSRTCATVF